MLATLFPIIHGLQTNAPWHIEVQQFLANNGNRHIDIIFNSSTDWIKFNTESAFWGKIQLASLEMTAERDSFGLFLFNTDKDDIGGYLSKICPRMVRSSLLVFAQPGGGHEVSLLRQHLNKMSTEAFFYVAVRTNTSTECVKSAVARFARKCHPQISSCLAAEQLQYGPSALGTSTKTVKQTL